jgi:hypothetical protein
MIDLREWCEDWVQISFGLSTSSNASDKEWKRRLTEVK